MGSGDAVNGTGRGSGIAVVIPCFRVGQGIGEIVRRVLPHADAVIVVDDACPDQTADAVEALALGPKVTVMRNPRNLGVGGAVIAGYRAALAAGHRIILKFDGDGQMEPELISLIVAPIAEGRADYVKGNRFFNIADVAAMPRARLVGNVGLSFMSKLATGYWSNFDPTNGFTAIHARVLERLPLDRIARDYFFESDMLFRLGALRACVVDLPMPAIYAGEVSSLPVRRSLFTFFARNCRNTVKRLFYNYILRDFSVASLYLILVLLLVPLGLATGAAFWLDSFRSGVAATSGEVMLAGLPLILGTQFLLAFIAYDVEATPSRALHPLLPERALAPFVERGDER